MFSQLLLGAAQRIETACYIGTIVDSMTWRQAKYPAPCRPFGRPSGHAEMRPRRGLLKLLRELVETIMPVMLPVFQVTFNLNFKLKFCFFKLAAGTGRGSGTVTRTSRVPATPKTVTSKISWRVFATGAIQA